MVVDHSAAAPYRLVDINEIEADILALNTVAWGGPPIGALVFRDPSTIESFSSVSLDPLATGVERLEMGTHQFGMLAGVVASVEYLANLDESATGTRRERLVGLNAIGGGLHGPAVRLPADVAAVAAAGDGDRPARGAHSRC